jgi:uncharacterized delta-60 repeat protein
MFARPQRLRRSLLVSLIVGLITVVAAPLASAAPSDLDPTLAGNGILRQRFAAENWARGSNVVVQPDGKFLVGGEGYADDGFSGTEQLLARFNPDGSLDPGFGVGGYVLTDYETFDSDNVADIAVLPDGRILTGGSADWDSNDDSTLSLFLPNGAPDNSFSGDGKLRFDADLSEAGVDNVSQVAITADGKIVVAGSVLRSGDFDVYVKRFLMSGAPDPLFNSGNTYLKHLYYAVSDSDDFAAGLVVRADGSIVVAARYETSASTSNAALLGLTPEGLDDTTFGDGVTSSRLLAGGASDSYPIDLVEQADGKLVILYNDYSGAATATGLTRWNATATERDSSFGTAGVLTISRGSDSLSPSAFVRLGDGSFLVGGNQYDASLSSNSYFAKVTSGGVLDPAFGTGGLHLVDSGADTERLSDVAVQPDGKFLSVGTASSSSTLPSSVQVIRLLGNYVAPAAVPVPLTAKITSPSKSKLKASKLKSISGTAAGTGLTKVQLAIQRIDGKLLKKQKKCRFVKNSKGATKNFKAVKKKCTPTKYLTAKGTTSWKYLLKLKPGKYKLYVRSVGTDGVAGTSVTKTFTLTK